MFGGAVMLMEIIKVFAYMASLSVFILVWAVGFSAVF
jgi:hypothetical protein